MTLRHRFSSALVILLVLSLAASSFSCTSSQPQRFRMSFLPPMPPPSQPVQVVLDQPSLPSNLYANETPNYLPPATISVPPRPTLVETRIRQADEHYIAGQRAYQEGRFTEARLEFNRAVDILLGAPDSAPDRAKLEHRLDQLVENIYRYDVEGLGAGVSPDQVVYDKSPLDSILEMTFPVDPKLKPKVTDEIHATASQLPLEENDTVLSYINFFSSDRGRKVLQAGLRRSGRYRPLIEKVLAEEGVPQELIYLAQAESGFLPRAVSRKQATGMWQFVQFRGREYGLQQTRYSDDRLDPEKATHAAAQHLRDLFTHFGDWYLALAAYNCGPGCVDKAVQRTGYADFWTLRSLNVLPRETMNYVPLILAITIMAKNPKDYSLDTQETDSPVEYETLQVREPTSLALLADASGRSLTDLRDLNPALLKSVAPAGYQVRLPKGLLTQVKAAVDAVPAGHRATWRVHRVSQGDTFASIARTYRLTPAALEAVNRESVSLDEGNFVVIPISYPASKPAVKRAVKRGTTASSRTATRGKPAAATKPVAKVTPKRTAA